MRRSLLVGLSDEEVAFVEEMAAAKLAIKTDSSKTVSKYDEMKIACMGIAGEFAVCKGLGLMFDPFPYRGGDGHSGDCWRGLLPNGQPALTVSVKTRHGHLTPDFLFPTRQEPKNQEFPDTYGVVGLWREPYSVLELVGYFSFLEWPDNRQYIEVGGTRSGFRESRLGYPASKLLPIEEIELEVDMVPDATISIAQTHGYVRCFRHWLDSRGDSVQRWNVRTALDNAISLDRSLQLD